MAAVLIHAGTAVRAQGPQPPPDAHIRSQWDGVYTDAQAERGRPIYLAKCAMCHGRDLMGIPPPPGDPRDPLFWRQRFGSQLVGNVLWNELSLGDLFERMRISMPQNNPGSLSRQQAADVLAFILQQSNYPSGSAELPTVTLELNAIQFLAERPK